MMLTMPSSQTVRAPDASPTSTDRVLVCGAIARAAPADRTAFPARHRTPVFDRIDRGLARAQSLLANLLGMACHSLDLGDLGDGLESAVGTRAAMAAIADLPSNAPPPLPSSTQQLVNSRPLDPSLLASATRRQRCCCQARGCVRKVMASNQSRRRARRRGASSFQPLARPLSLEARVR